MIFNQTRMASIILAFGIFFTSSCAHFISDKSSGNATDKKQYENALINIQQEIEEAPDNNELKVQKAEILFQLAKTTPAPALREAYYKNIFDTVQEVNYQTNSEHPELKKLTTDAWTFEQSQGVALLQKDDSDNFEKHFNAIIAHFDNATTVLPDSVVTYTLKATTYYRHGDVNSAIETLETANDKEGHFQPDINEKLAYLYLEAGDLKTSISRYQILVEQDPDSYHYKSGLANAYILNKNHEDAIPLLRELSESFPSRYEYQEALATELYYIFSGKVNGLLAGGGEKQMEKDDFETLLSSLNEIHEIFDTLESKLPSLQNGLERTASFYKNIALKFSKLAPFATETLKEDIKQTETEFYQKALPLWQNLAESNPDNMEYRKNLYQVYLALDMENDAEGIERSLNL